MRRRWLSRAWLVPALLLVAGFLPAQAQKLAPAPQVLTDVPVTIPSIENTGVAPAAFAQVRGLHLRVVEAVPVALAAADKPHRLRAERLLQEIPRRLENAERIMDRDPKGAAIQIREALKGIERVQRHLKIELPAAEGEVKP